MLFSMCIQDQLRRFMEVHMTDMPPIVAAKKTKEFRSTPHEQVCSKGFSGIYLLYSISEINS